MRTQAVDTANRISMLGIRGPGCGD